MFFDYIPLVLAQPNPDAPPAGKDKAGTATPGAKDAPAKDAAKDSATTGTPGTPGAPTGTPTGTPAPNPFGGSFMFILMGGLLLMIIFSMRSQRKERKKREDLLGTLKKGDRVQTIGGMLATVVEVREDRVVLKADENTNTKLTYVRSAIQAILSDKAADKPEPDVKA